MKIADERAEQRAKKPGADPFLTGLKGAALAIPAVLICSMAPGAERAHEIAGAVAIGVYFLGPFFDCRSRWAAYDRAWREEYDFAEAERKRLETAWEFAAKPQRAPDASGAT